MADVVSLRCGGSPDPTRRFEISLCGSRTLIVARLTWSRAQSRFPSNCWSTATMVFLSLYRSIFTGSCVRLRLVLALYGYWFICPARILSALPPLARAMIKRSLSYSAVVLSELDVSQSCGRCCILWTRASRCAAIYPCLESSRS